MNLNDALEDACYELWELTSDKPYLQEIVTVWDAFKYLCAKSSGVVPND
jgi:hypothetical protein